MQIHSALFDIFCLDESLVFVVFSAVVVAEIDRSGEIKSQDTRREEKKVITITTK